MTVNPIAKFGFGVSVSFLLSLVAHRILICVRVTWSKHNRISEQCIWLLGVTWGYWAAHTFLVCYRITWSLQLCKVNSLQVTVSQQQLNRYSGISHRLDKETFWCFQSPSPTHIWAIFWGKMYSFL